ncbi:hypothetical protein DL89DRAFT_8691 [Linderina pennispora]|uniref:Uncharacterized protein n=1 Tax=Linderina pennispora TaxID=61395 RepID=A0A1Y1WLJ2_9FUNG|nr:uncharacterized protein DL89DRAFT_8691 [Linderina pennispora]ORX74056.1 hypothetical protein DL89DRAFT_8691 [Linderina pennispora]
MPSTLSAVSSTTLSASLSSSVSFTGPTALVAATLLMERSAPVTAVAMPHDSRTLSVDSRPFSSRPATTDAEPCCRPCTVCRLLCALAAIPPAVPAYGRSESNSRSILKLPASPKPAAARLCCPVGVLGSILAARARVAGRPLPLVDAINAAVVDSSALWAVYLSSAALGGGSSSSSSLLLSSLTRIGARTTALPLCVLITRTWNPCSLLCVSASCDALDFMLALVAVRRTCAPSLLAMGVFGVRVDIGYPVVWVRATSSTCGFAVRCAELYRSISDGFLPVEYSRRRSVCGPCSPASCVCNAACFKSGVDGVYRLLPFNSRALTDRRSPVWLLLLVECFWLLTTEEHGCG